MKKYDIVINSNELCIPQIINFSVLKVKGSEFVKKLSDNGICVSSGSACCSSIDESVTLDVVYNNNKNISASSIRVSISYKTSEEEINKFLEIFDKIYKEI